MGLEPSILFWRGDWILRVTWWNVIWICRFCFHCSRDVCVFLFFFGILSLSVKGPNFCNVHPVSLNCNCNCLKCCYPPENQHVPLEIWWLEVGSDVFPIEMTSLFGGRIRSFSVVWLSVDVYPSSISWIQGGEKPQAEPRGWGRETGQAEKGGVQNFPEASSYTVDGWWF